jgi:hypothetical protein
MKSKEHSRKRTTEQMLRKVSPCTSTTRAKAVQTHDEEHRQLEDMSGKKRLPKGYLS